MSLEILGCPAYAGTASQAVNDENFDIAVSMGPQPNGHGYRTTSGRARRPTSFQWGHNPTVMDTRVIYAEINKISTKFQWGHNPTVMDTLFEKLAAMKFILVSMGPQPNGHGYSHGD